MYRLFCFSQKNENLSTAFGIFGSRPRLSLEVLSFLTRLGISLQKKAFQNLRTPRIALKTLHYFGFTSEWNIYMNDWLN